MLSRRLADEFDFVVTRREPVAGGDINQAECWTGRDGRRLFIKFNRAERLAMFDAEAEGLNDIADTGAIRVPRPICTGIEDGRAYLVLEYLALTSRGNAAELGRRLAALHAVTAPRYGWRRDNTIGATPQPNGWLDNWVDFLRERRLGYQLALAEKHGASSDLMAKGERLLTKLPSLFRGYTPAASLLHGDLWGGNYGYAEGEPVLFDPAVYYGDRESDLAMTELFGGFSAGFYTAYREAWPLDPGYETRRTLYNLYHVLNHFNLFGGGYGGQAERMIGMLLAELG